MSKKITILITVFITLLMQFSVTYSETGIKAFYSGKVFSCSQLLLDKNNNYLIKSSDFDSITGSSTSFDIDNKIVTIKFSGAEYACALETENTDASVQISYSLPVIIKDSLYLPLDFIKNTFNLLIKYDKDSAAIYVLPSNQSYSTETYDFINITNKYSVASSKEFYLDFNQSGSEFSDTSIAVHDTDQQYSAIINCDSFSTPTVNAIKKYSDDANASNEKLFDKFVEYRKSSYDSLNTYFTNTFLLGDKNGNEAAMKMISKSEGSLYGVKTYQYIYDTGRFNSTKWEEKIHVDFVIPVYANGTIYNVDFTLDKGLINDTTLKKMTGLLQSIQIEGLSSQQDIPDLFKDAEVINAANKGIYSTTYDNKDTTSIMLGNNYSVSIPSAYIPWNSNSISYDAGYTSYKINENTDISFSYEPSETVDTIVKKIDSVSATIGSNVSITDLGNINIGKRDFIYVLYQTGTKENPQYFYDFYTYSGTELYTFRYHSKTCPIESEINNLHNILQTFKPSVNLMSEVIPPAKNEITYQSYGGKEAGFSISVPQKWIINKKADKESNDIVYTVKSPDYSGSFDISIYNKDTAAIDLFRDKQYKILSSSIYINDGITSKRTLVNYLGSDGKRRLSFIKELRTKNSTYTLVVSVNEYMTSNGRITDNSINSIINTISRTFKLINE